jgi:phenol 2-monooxygenase
MNGFNTGDPSVSVQFENQSNQTDAVDLLIVGCGPAGLTLAAQLAAFPDITVRIAEQKPTALDVGQADGIASRSIEMFQSFGFAEKVIKEGYWVNEVAFWRPDADGADLHRANRIEDVEDDVSEMPHVILSQARVHDFYLDIMQKSARNLVPDYNRELKTLTNTGDAKYPITATFDCVDTDGKTETLKARYVVGCDGASSTVRKSMGLKLNGRSARQLWGVMDVLVVTDFPDIRLKAAIQSADHGSILIIPREGGYMVRMYVELDELRGDERAADRNVTADMLVDKARDILAPFTLDVKEVAWCSAYEIGQRVCDTFDDVPEGDRDTRQPRIFIAGDACHTHSPKAGQGMNVSMADTYNLGWKLASVLRGQATPDLLHSYTEERQAKAQELIDFDRDMAHFFSAKPKDAAEATQLQAYFELHGRYTAGVETQYQPSLITGDETHQNLASGLKVGMRFHSAPVVRLGDAKPMQLAQMLKADGRWRMIAFAGAGDVGAPDGHLAKLCEHLTEDAESPVVRYTGTGANIDSVIDVRAVFQEAHWTLELEKMPSLLLPRKGQLGLVDYEKIFCPDVKNGPNIFDQRGIDRHDGALVILRPDQFVSAVLPLSDFAGISSFFDRFMIAS